MRASKIAVVVGVGVASVLAVAIAVLQSLDFNEYKAVIIDAVRDATGRELVLEGDLGLRVGLAPRLIVDGVRFRNAPWGSRPDMMTVKRFELTVGLLPLLRGEIDMQRVVFIEPDILLESNAKGEQNWIFTGGESKKDAGAAWDFTLGTGYATNARIVYHDAASQKIQTLVLEALATTIVEGGTRVQLQTKAVYNQVAVELEGRLGRLRELLRGLDFPLDVTVRALDAEVKVQGTVSNFLDAAKVDLRFDAQVESTAKLAALANADVPDIGPVHVTGALRNPEGAFRLDDLALSARLGQAGLKGEGKVANVLAPSGIDLVFKLDAPSMAAFAALTGDQPLPQVGPLAVSGRLLDVKGGYQIRKLNYRLGESDLAGEITVQSTGERRRITAALQSALLDLDAISPTPGEAPADAGGTTESAEKPARVFPDARFPVEALRSLDADFSLKVARFRSGGATYENLEYKVKLEKGRLDIEPFKAGIAGGTLNINATLDASKKVPRLESRVDIKGVELGRLVDQFDKGLMSGMPLTVKLRMKGDGFGLREVLADARGELSVQAGKGSIDYAKLTKSDAGSILDVRTLIAPSLKPIPTVDIYCAVVRFAIANGQAVSSRSIAVESGRINLAGGGHIDLRTEALDLTIKPTPRAGVSLGGAALADLVAIGGTLAEPAPKADVLGIAKSGASVGAAVMTGGLSLLGQVVYDQVAKDREPCKTALAAELETPGKPTPVTASKEAPPERLQDALMPADGG